MRVVLDTNVLVAAGRSRHGASSKLISMIPDTRFESAVSLSLYLEYLSVLGRPENILPGRTPGDVVGFVREFLTHSHRQRIYFSWRPTLNDPDDDFILELAIASKSTYIVTFNKKDFRGSELFGIRAVWPSEFLELIKEV